MTRLNLDCPRECLPLHDWSASLSTRSGHSLHVRPVRDEDAAALDAFLKHMSVEDRRFRFPGHDRASLAERLKEMTAVDHVATEHFIGVLPHSHEIIASALVTTDAAHEVAGVAIAIDRRYKDQGFGWALLAHVARFARSHGYLRLVSVESAQNRGALAVEQDMGFTISPLPGDKDLLLVEAEL